MHDVFGKINCGGLKHNSLYLGLELPSDGWQSLIGMFVFDQYLRVEPFAVPYEMVSCPCSQIVD